MAEALTALESGAGLSVSAKALPGVWLSADHQCIVWCNQLTQLLATALLRTVARTQQATLPLGGDSRVEKPQRSAAEVFFEEIGAKAPAVERWSLLPDDVTAHRERAQQAQAGWSALLAEPHARRVPSPPAACDNPRSVLMRIHASLDTYLDVFGL